MKKIVFVLLGSGCLFFSLLSAKEPTPANATSPTKKNSEEKSKPQEKEEGIVYFTPPSGWRMADPNVLPSHVRVMVVGSGPSAFPPSLNLSWEPYKGTLKDYLKIIKNMNSAQGYEWKDLGSIRTEAGNGSLSQVDTKSQWGEVRLMHVILVKNGNVYILTASALKNDFSIFYKDFFAAMRSLKIVNDLYEFLPDTQQRTQLKNATAKLQTQWKNLVAEKQKEDPSIALNDIQESVFANQNFQNTIWKPFLEMLDQKYGQLGAEWLALFKQKMENDLFNLKN